MRSSVNTDISQPTSFRPSFPSYQEKENSFYNNFYPSFPRELSANPKKPQTYPSQLHMEGERRSLLGLIGVKTTSKETTGFDRRRKL